MEQDEKQFAKAFNVGYELSKHDPDLLDKLLKSKNENSEYLKAVHLGKKEHDREKLLAQIKQSQKSKGLEHGL